MSYKSKQQKKLDKATKFFEKLANSNELVEEHWNVIFTEILALHFKIDYLRGLDSVMDD